MMYIHSNNETVKRINVSKIANTSILNDNSTAAGCSSRLITVLVQHAHDKSRSLSSFRYEGFVMWALPKMIVLIPVFW